MIDGRIKYSDPAVLQTKVDEYFMRCEASKEQRELKSGDVRIRQEFPTVVGLALHLGLHRDTLYAYMNGEVPECIDEGIRKTFSDIFRDAKQRIEQTTLQAAMLGDAQDRISAMVLGRWGYRNADDNASVTVKLIGVDGSDTDKYSR